MHAGAIIKHWWQSDTAKWGALLLAVSSGAYSLASVRGHDLATIRANTAAVSSLATAVENKADQKDLEQLVTWMRSMQEKVEKANQQLARMNGLLESVLKARNQ